ncbi:MAG TPA: HEAT repeat domain-containing protein [Ktedonobacteraceae bacterium]|nr:HEAT repeat domain-containing protein [Ktedonobacteraceae bacterium]
MLEQLSSINWRDLSHAYGSAEDVPQLLRDLASPDEQICGRARGTLYTNIYHQGTVYQASSYAVPFLLELLREETVPEREELLVLLAHLAQGNTYHRQHWHFYTEERKQDPTIHKELEEGIFWVEKTYEAVSAGLPLYFSLLEDPNPKLRLAALRLLGSLFREAPQIVSLLVKRFDTEHDQRVQASLLFSLGALLARREEASPSAWQLLAKTLDEGQTDLVRLAAAMALARTRRPEIPASAYEFLLDKIQYPDPLDDLYDELPWAESRLVFDVIRHFYTLPSSFFPCLLPRLMQVLESLDQREERGDLKLNGIIAGELADLLIALVFDANEGSPTKAWMRKDLTNLQEVLLFAILQSNVVWRWDVGKGYSMTSRPSGKNQYEILVEIMLYELQKQGLPWTRQTLRTFLGGDPQDNDVVRIVSRQVNVWLTPPEQKKEVLAELIALNPDCQLAVLKMLVGDYSS